VKKKLSSWTLDRCIEQRGCSIECQGMSGHVRACQGIAEIQGYNSIPGQSTASGDAITQPSATVMAQISAKLS